MVQYLPWYLSMPHMYDCIHTHTVSNKKRSKPKPTKADPTPDPKVDMSPQLVTKPPIKPEPLPVQSEVSVKIKQAAPTTKPPEPKV